MRESEYLINPGTILHNHRCNGNALCKVVLCEGIIGIAISYIVMQDNA